MTSNDLGGLRSADVNSMSTDIFLSYAREDASKAMELARILEKDGWSVWWDKEISPGQDFEIEHSLRFRAGVGDS